MEKLFLKKNRSRFAWRGGFFCLTLWSLQQTAFIWLLLKIFLSLGKFNVFCSLNTISIVEMDLLRRTASKVRVLTPLVGSTEVPTILLLNIEFFVKKYFIFFNSKVSKKFKIPSNITIRCWPAKLGFCQLWSRPIPTYISGYTPALKHITIIIVSSKFKSIAHPM